MAARVIELAADSQLRNQLGAAGRERAHTYFSLERMLRDHTGIYNAPHKK